MTLLAQSGGIRATDSLEMFPLPVFDPERGRYLAHFFMHGSRHLAPHERERALRLRPDDELDIRHEGDNPVDPNAIVLVTTPDGIRVGWVPRYLVDEVWELAEACAYMDVYVLQLNAPPAPVQQRLLCRLESCWPSGHVSFASDTYQPIPADASELIRVDTTVSS